MVKKVYSVCSYHYIETAWFSIEKMYIGNNAENEAIKLALNMNIHHLKYGEYYCKDNYKIDCKCESEYEYEEQELTLDEGYIILTNTTKSEKERLEEYISYLDYSNGNYRYENVIFFDVIQSSLEELV